MTPGRRYRRWKKGSLLPLFWRAFVGCRNFEHNPTWRYAA